MSVVLHLSRTGAQNPRATLSTLYLRTAWINMGRRAIRQRRSTRLRVVCIMPSLRMCRPVYYEIAQVLSEPSAKGE